MSEKKKNKKRLKSIHVDLKKELQRSIKLFLFQNELTWQTIQKVDIKTKLGCPTAWRTLHRIKCDIHVHINNVAKLLEFFDIPHTKRCNFLDVKELENDEV